MNDIINSFPEKYRADIEKASEILKKYGCSEISKQHFENYFYK